MKDKKNKTSDNDVTPVEKSTIVIIQEALKNQQHQIDDLTINQKWGLVIVIGWALKAVFEMVQGVVAMIGGGM